MSHALDRNSPATFRQAPAPPLAPQASPRLAPQRFTAPRALLWPAISLTLALAALFSWTIAKMWERWNAPHGYYSHGPLIVPIALATACLIIRRRGLPLNSTSGASFAALALLAASLLVHLASMYARVTFVSGFALIPVLAAILLYLGGWPMLRRLWFPIAFLAFMVPLPDLAIGDINFRLKMLAAHAATTIVNGLGTPAYLRGAQIFLQHGRSLTVEDACSGLRSLISLLAFATLFTYVCKLRGYKRLLLLASTVPVALAANIVRIITLTLVADSGRLAAASPGGWAHELMGFLVFIIALACMFLLEELFNLLPGARGAQWLVVPSPETRNPPRAS